MTPTAAQGSGSSDHDLLIEIKTTLQIFVTKIEDHENRLRDVERKVWRAAGAASILGVLVGSLIAPYVNK